MFEPGAINIKKVLLAEDDDDDFNLLNAAIISMCSSIEVLRTENGITMFSLLQASPKPDIILLDINLPYKNGLICLKEIKHNPDLSSIRVIMNSTSSNAKDIETSYNLGAEFYLVKQSSWNAIKKQLNKLFQNDFFINKIRPPKEQFLLNLR
jgi:DNA-binding NarL/FixJ family response regulator